MILKNDKTELEIERDHRPSYACQWYKATLLSGEWPDDLVTVCDNSSLTNTSRSHFGGHTESISGNNSVRYVKVHTD